MEYEAKIARLHAELAGLAPFVIAFSAGKDSAFLAREAVRAVGRDRFVAVFIDSPLIGERDRQRLEYFRKRLRIPVSVVRTDPLAEANIAANSQQRCYHCKRFLFGALLEHMKTGALPQRLLDGSTASDLNQYRPGARAMVELGVVSPLRLAGIGSAEIVTAMRAWRVPAWLLSSSSCLATRLPYGRPLQDELLRRVEAMESFWHRAGIHDVRCRAIEDGCRVELPERVLGRALAMRAAALSHSRAVGFRWLALDLQAVRSGPWDPEPGGSRPV